jgi:thiamine monophosphate synthase
MAYGSISAKQQEILNYIKSVIINRGYPPAVREICEAVHIPVVAIGGITKDNLHKLKGSGIAGISVISAIFAQPDVRKATEELKKKTEEMLS